MESRVLPRTLTILLTCFVLFTVFYSFKRYHYFPVDGDLPAIVVGHKAYSTVMKDPFGMNALLHDSVYAAPNRYFAHLSMSAWFMHAPLWFKPLVGPVNSIYYASALAKTIFHFFIAWLLAAAVTGKLRPWHPQTIAALALLLPLFQVFGYNWSLGIIDASITYTFFYAGAFSLVLLFFFPAFLSWHHRLRSNIFLPWLLLAVVMSLNGSLNAPVTVLLSLMLLISTLYTGTKTAPASTLPGRLLHTIRQRPSRTTLLLFCATMLALYSLYIGTFNQENLWQTLPLSERYEKLPHGLRLQFTEKLAWPLLLLVIVLNVILVSRHRSDDKARRILIVFRWILLFSILYFALLPLGGFRSYRPYIVRMDTLLPVTVAAFFFYLLSTHYLLFRLPAKAVRFYIATIVVFLAVFINADLDTLKYNACEREALESLSSSTGKVVLLEKDCPVLSWNKTTNPQDTEVKCELLLRWGVLKEKKLFYQD